MEETRECSEGRTIKASSRTKATSNDKGDPTLTTDLQISCAPAFAVSTSSELQVFCRQEVTLSMKDWFLHRQVLSVEEQSPMSPAAAQVK